MALMPSYQFEDAINPIQHLFRSSNSSRQPRHNTNLRGNPLGPQFSRPKDSAFFLRDYSPMDRGLANQVVGLKIADNDKFQIIIDVHHFAPDEISVKVIDGYIIVEGKHEEKCDEHGYVSRQFVRKCELPQGCLADTVESRLSSDGVLFVTAPKVLPLPSKGEKIVPIIYTA